MKRICTWTPRVIKRRSQFAAEAANMSYLRGMRMAFDWQQGRSKLEIVEAIDACAEELRSQFDLGAFTKGWARACSAQDC